jgi:hypothetical protein
MKKFFFGLAGFAVLGLSVSHVSVLYAGDEGCAGKKAEVASSGSGGCGKPCHASAGGAATENAAVQAVLASLPSIKYRVGENVGCCANGASVMAKTEGKPVEYMVGDDVFATEAEAKVKLAALYEKEIENMTALQFSVGGEYSRCPMTAKSMAEKSKATIAYKVGGVEFADKEKAEATVKLVADAAAAVKMSYKVEGKSFCCDKMAGVAAKDSGKPIVFVVGAEEAPDEATAKLLYAQAKIRAIVEAAASAQPS